MFVQDLPAGACAAAVDTRGNRLELLTPEQYLTAATLSLPGTLAVSMKEALALDTYRIRAGRYADEWGVCPLAAADHFAALGTGEFGDAENYGGKLLRFAVSFDLCTAEKGLDAALGVVRTTLERRLVLSA